MGNVGLRRLKAQTSISGRLLIWFDRHGRHNLPWQSKPVNPYHVWLSEIMLQQTQVATVVGYFNAFTLAFPTIVSLADASEDQVLSKWAGLGYYARARNLHKSAKLMCERHNAQVPNDKDALLALPGIGLSTAGAILSLAFNQTHAILDGNVKRVLSRYHQVQGHYGQSQTINKLWQLAKRHTPENRNDDYTQAIMDLGATVCVRSEPKCDQCPIQADCLANQNNAQKIYPQSKPKKHKPTKSLVMLIFQNKAGDVHLKKRPNKGVWSGLWSFIECKPDSQSIKKTIREYTSKKYNIRRMDLIKHSFTHYHLNIQPIIVSTPQATIKNNMDFFAIDSNDLGVPSPVAKIIARLQAER